MYAPEQRPRHFFQWQFLDCRAAHAIDLVVRAACEPFEDENAEPPFQRELVFGCGVGSCRGDHGALDATMFQEDGEEGAVEFGNGLLEDELRRGMGEWVFSSYRALIGYRWPCEGDKYGRAVGERFFCFVYIGELALDDVDLGVGGCVLWELAGVPGEDDELVAGFEGFVEEYEAGGPLNLVVLG